jgi:WXXGXW repeat (2 copies)
MRKTQWIKFCLFSILILVIAVPSFAQIRVSIRFGPPPLPVYEQPLCPGPNYIWTPGYWAYDYDDQDYYWVPGTWIMAPQVGFLWTPGWWGWGGDGFLFHEGFWGPVVGFYGGINYGFGYFGNGYEGGRWDHDQFYYNRAVNNVNVTEIHNVYNTTVINNTTVNRISYNGGEGGITARPTPEQEAAANQRHLPPVQAQVQHAQGAKSEPQQRASVNHGKPVIAASARPADFKGAGVVPAKEAGGAYNPPPRGTADQTNARAAKGEPATQHPENGKPAETNQARPGTEQARPEANQARPGTEQARPETNQARPENNQPPTHAKDVTPWKPAPPAKGSNAMMDQKYQQQQQKLATQQEKQRQKLETQQERDHQKMAKQQADETHKQQVEQQHSQQTQKMQERQTQQRQQLQQKYQPPKNEQPHNEQPHNEAPHGL